MQALSLRFCAPLAVALLWASCSTPEQRADAAFAELCALAEQVQRELAAVVDPESAERALPGLEERAEAIRDVLARLDALAEDADLPPEARRRVGARYHAPLHAAVSAALEQSHRLVVRHALYQCKGLERLARREYAHYGARGVHPWPRAVYAGREYRPKAPTR